MCGILGRFYREPSHGSALTEAEVATLAHRGPDGRGTYTDTQTQLGHTRLAIIDLSDRGKQPMAYDNGRYVVVYNGEIYNYIELRSQLATKGERFLTSADTEVLLAAYKVWGSECVTHFRGMFAFALWDKKEKTLFLARDRCGEKPLFYRRDDQCLYFASEMKGLMPLIPNRPSMDVGIVDMYMHYQYVPEPFTLLTGVRKLPAGHTLQVSTEQWEAEPVRYWSVEEIPKLTGLPTNRASILECIREKLEEAVTLTLRSDVPVGIALSGGVDSGAIAALAQKHSSVPMHAFAVGYPGRPAYDERAQARQLADRLGLVMHELELPVDGFIDFFPQLVRIMDEPIADPAAFGHYSIPKAAADMGIKVLLTGIGGDEIFWGYPWVAECAFINEAITRIPFLGKSAPLSLSERGRQLLVNILKSRLSPYSLRLLVGALLKATDTSTPKDQLCFYAGTPDFRDARNIKAAVYGPAMQAVREDNVFRPTNIGYRSAEQIPAAVIRLLFDTWLVSNCLTLGDRVSMSVGVESRLPFLDVHLIELVMALRSRVPDHTLGQKAWLRQALKGVLPDDLLARPKAGFQPPVWSWLSGVIERYGATLRDGILTNSGIIDSGQVDYILQRMPRSGWSGLLFAYKLLLLEMWHREVVQT